MPVHCFAGHPNLSRLCGLYAKGLTILTDVFSEGAAWMRGRIIPIGEACIPITDWGLTHCDITYDVVPVWKGGMFRLPAYLDRFEASMAALHLDPDMTRDAIQSALIQMVAASGLRNSYVAMVCSRGTPTIAGSRDPRHCRNHFYAWCVPYVQVIRPEVIAKGASACIAQTVQRIPDGSVDPIVKNYHWGDFTKGLFEAKDAGFETVILTDANGNITEGPGFNVFAIKHGKLLTSGHGVLSGITRRTVLEIATQLGLQVDIRPLPQTVLLDADEVFISSSAGGVIPIVKVNETIFAGGACGPATQSIYQTYWDWMAAPAYRTEIIYNN